MTGRLVENANLVELLSEHRMDVPELPDEALQTWSEDAIRAFFTQSGSQPGGARRQSIVEPPHLTTPSIVKQHQLAGTVAGYRQAAKADGIPSRASGLFPPQDSLLDELQQLEGCWPFEKHLAGLQSPYELLPAGSWTSGNAAAEYGFDLRLFYQEKHSNAEHGCVLGAARLGEKASIGNGYWMTAHGGAIESVLDESTAELAKMELSPMLSTVEANFKIRKPVPLFTSLFIKCEVQSINGLRCWVDGKILHPDGTVLATCTALLIDLQPLKQLEYARQQQQTHLPGKSMTQTKKRSPI